MQRAVSFIHLSCYSGIWTQNLRACRLIPSMSNQCDAHSKVSTIHHSAFQEYSKNSKSIIKNEDLKKLGYVSRYCFQNANACFLRNNFGSAVIQPTYIQWPLMCCLWSVPSWFSKNSQFWWMCQWPTEDGEKMLIHLECLVLEEFHSQNLPSCFFPIRSALLQCCSAVVSQRHCRRII